MSPKKSMAITVSSELSFFKSLLKQWPSMKYGIMSEIGYQGRQGLYKDFLRGQAIKLTNAKYPRDSVNRRTVNYRINKKRTSVMISSYTLNPHRPREVYAAAATALGPRIKAGLQNQDEVIQKRIDRFQRSGE